VKKAATSYEDVNEMLDFFTEGIARIFGQGLSGIYLTGSLSYDAFNYNSSDIDVTVIIQHSVVPRELDAIRALHVALVQRFNKWARRFECSYTPVGNLPNILPPGNRPWYWGADDILYGEATYGNEWIINNYLLYKHAVPLVGPDFKQLMPPVSIDEVQKACIRDLFTEWEPKKSDRQWFKDSHYESYFILNLCRILYTVMCKDAGSKKAAASWVKSTCVEPWPALVSAAERWEHGRDLHLQDKALVFLDFVIENVLATELGKQMVGEIGAIRQCTHLPSSPCAVHAETGEQPPLNGR
jgi:Aminoglycoside adenylyltransferase, C-terminal domain